MRWALVAVLVLFVLAYAVTMTVLMVQGAPSGAL